MQEANSFCDFLWFHLDSDGRASCYGNVLRIDFDPELILEHWPTAKAVILDQLEPLRGTLSTISVRIPKERALLANYAADPKYRKAPSEPPTSLAQLAPNGSCLN